MGKKVISDTNGLWLIENGQKKLVKSYKMTFHGHYPMGYVNPEISADGKKLLYINRTQRPWEEIIFSTYKMAVRNGTLNIINLETMNDSILVHYLVYVPILSKNQKFCAYTKVNYNDKETDLLEILDMNNGVKNQLENVDLYFWFK